MNLKQYYPIFLGLLFGFLTGLHPIIGLVILIILIVYYHAQIKDTVELLTETNIEKIQIILLIGIFGFGLVMFNENNIFYVNLLIILWVLIMCYILFNLANESCKQRSKLEKAKRELKYSILFEEH